MNEQDLNETYVYINRDEGKAGMDRGEGGRDREGGGGYHHNNDGDFASLGVQGQGRRIGASEQGRSSNYYHNNNNDGVGVGRAAGTARERGGSGSHYNNNYGDDAGSSRVDETGRGGAGRSSNYYASDNNDGSPGMNTGRGQYQDSYLNSGSVDSQRRIGGSSERGRYNTNSKGYGVDSDSDSQGGGGRGGNGGGYHDSRYYNEGGGNIGGYHDTRYKSEQGDDRSRNVDATGGTPGTMGKEEGGGIGDGGRRNKFYRQRGRTNNDKRPTNPWNVNSNNYATNKNPAPFKAGPKPHNKFQTYGKLFPSGNQHNSYFNNNDDDDEDNSDENDDRQDWAFHQSGDGGYYQYLHSDQLTDTLENDRAQRRPRNAQYAEEIGNLEMEKKKQKYFGERHASEINLESEELEKELTDRHIQQNMGKSSENKFPDKETFEDELKGENGINDTMENKIKDRGTYDEELEGWEKRKLRRERNKEKRRSKKYERDHENEYDIIKLRAKRSYDGDHNKIQEDEIKEKQQTTYDCLAVMTYVDSYKSLLTSTSRSRGRDVLCWLVVDQNTIVILKTSSCNSQTAQRVLAAYYAQNADLNVNNSSGFHSTETQSHISLLESPSQPQNTFSQSSLGSTGSANPGDARSNEQGSGSNSRSDTPDPVDSWLYTAYGLSGSSHMSSNHAHQSSNSAHHRRPLTPAQKKEAEELKQHLHSILFLGKGDRDCDAMFPGQRSAPIEYKGGDHDNSDQPSGASSLVSHFSSFSLRTCSLLGAIKPLILQFFLTIFIQFLLWR
jgi:hypothetical protein